MTVQLEKPAIRFVANGEEQFFDFEWSSLDPNEVEVRRNDEVLGSEQYEVVNYDPANGGRIYFYAPPDRGAIIALYRKTPITQEVDYVEGEPFPADTHEEQMDKDTRILQEIVYGGRALGGFVDLTAVPQIDSIDIENTSGTDATIYPWSCDGRQAGAFLGQISNKAPEDGTTTSKPDGFVWYEIEQGPPPPGSGIIFPTTIRSIVMNTPTLRIFHGVGGDPAYPNASILEQIGSQITRADDYLLGPITELNAYHFKVDIVDRDTRNTALGADLLFNEWHDAYQVTSEDSNQLYTMFKFVCTVNGGFVILRISVTPDNGAGEPDEAFTVTREYQIEWVL